MLAELHILGVHITTHVKSVGKIKKLSKLPNLREHARDLAKKYGTRLIGTINTVEKGLAMARRRSLYLLLDTFYQLVEKALSSCLEDEDSGGKSLDTTCFEERLQVLLKQHEKELKKTTAEKELNTRLSELRQLLVDYCLKLGDRESIVKFFSYLERWVKNIREEVEVWLSIRESISRKGVDYARIVREIRSLQS